MSRPSKELAGRHPNITDAEIVRKIGGDKTCDIVIHTIHPDVASLTRRGDRLFLRDRGTGEDVLVNGERLPAKGEIEVSRYDDINIAGTAIVIGPEFFLGHAQVGIDTTPLQFIQPGANRTLCDGAFLRAKPSSLTCIIGPAGCGKTVFLNLINGYLAPTEGRILVGQSFDLNLDRQRLRNYIGYVPQDDVMIPELTVRQSLDYRLRLRFPDMAPAVRMSSIYETCLQIGISKSKIEEYLDTIIGSVESGQRGLSGGERKKANIAHELLLKPVILILDEPTSGLSSADADYIVKLLQRLAANEHITVVATIHQPSRIAFDCFDDLLVMIGGGRVAYYGPAREAAAFVEKASENPYPPDANPAEFIMNQVFLLQDAERVQKYYETHRGQLPSPLPLNRTSLLSPAGVRHASLWRRCAQALAQTRILIGRNFKVLRADRTNLKLTFGQIPILALMMLAAFHHYGDDGAAFEEFARKVHNFSVAKRPYQDEGKPIPVDALAEDAAAKSATDTELISRQAAHRRGAVYFMLVAASIWFGILGGCRDVVTEKHIIRRESRSCIDLPSYLAAKFTMQSCQTALQTALLLLLVTPFLLRLPVAHTVALWGILWVVAMTSAALGLAVSCVAPSYRAALTTIPILMIPQLLFGGILRPEIDMPEEVLAPRIVSFITIQRWGFEPALAMDRYARGGVITQEFSSETGTRYDAVNFLQFGDGSLLGCFFGEKSNLESVLLPLGLLMAAAAVFLAGGCVRLRKSLAT